MFISFGTRNWSCGAAGLLLFISGVVFADEPLVMLPASDIGAACLDRKNAASTEICYSFILGVVQTHASYHEQHGVPEAFCLPGDATRQQAITAIRKHFRRARNDARLPADQFVVRALAQAHPCPE